MRALVAGHAITILVLGLGTGLVMALLVTRALTTFLHAVQPTDATAMAMVATVLTGVALFACYVPARRATRVDPLIALRTE